MENYVLISGLIIFVGFKIFKIIKFSKLRKEIPSLIKNGAVIIDVRSRDEFKNACNSKSINIPVNELSSRIKELDKNRVTILCCASGARSSVAQGILKKNGFTSTINVGPWQNTLEN